jgi:hypothetical protein
MAVTNYGPNLIDFAPLAAIGQNIGEALEDRRRKEILSKIPRGPDGMPPLAALGAALLEMGDAKGAMTAATLARNASNDEFERAFKARSLLRQETEDASTAAYRNRSLGIQEKAATRKEVPFGWTVAPDGSRLIPAPGGPNDPATIKAQAEARARETTPLQAADKKAIIDAEDERPALLGTVETLKRARDLNSKTFTGYTAGIRGALGSRLPGAIVPDSIEEAAKATDEWQNTMGGEALTVMAASLKGATTNFELMEFQKRLADPSTPPKTRERIINRMLTLAERKLETVDSRIRDMRGGSYFKPDAAKPGASSKPDAATRFRQLIKEGKDEAAAYKALAAEGY